MARGVFIAKDGRLRPWRRPSVIVNGADTKILAGWTKIDGEWRQFWPPQVPAGIVVIGAGGGNGGNDRLTGYSGQSGHKITGIIPLGADQIIDIGIGGRGGDGYTGTGIGAGLPGFGSANTGGGVGGNPGASGYSGGGGGGGGASYISIDGVNIVVAAGGAGGGGGGMGYVPPPDPPPPANDPGPGSSSDPQPGQPAPAYNPPAAAAVAAADPPYEAPVENWNSGGDGIGDSGACGPGACGDSGSGGGAAGGDSGGDAGCFIGSTKVLMADGTTKSISSVRVGDLVRSDAGVVSVIYNRTRIGDVELVSMNGSDYFMTSNHAVFTDQGWAVYDIEYLQMTEPVQYQIVLANNNFKPLTPLREGLNLAYWINDELVYKPIEKLATINVKSKQVFWLNVTGNDRYIANGVVVHNES